MTDYKYSLVLICPETHLESARKLAIALGYQQPGGLTLSAPLSADGSAPATHWGARTSARQEMIDMLTAGVAPPGIDWSQYDTTETAVQAAIDAFIWDAQLAESEEPRAHYLRIAKNKAGLVPVDPDVEL